jgi:IS5 family transposase
VVRAVTLARNELAIALKCAAYNARRLVWLKAQEVAA